MNVFRLRFAHWMEDVVKYSRYVANGGLLFTLYFTLIYGAFVYNAFLEQVEPSFPTAWIVAVLFFLLPLGHRPRTFLKEADQVFLLPELGDFHSYMTGVRLFNGVFASLRAILSLLVLLPLVVRTMGVTSLEVMAIGMTALLLSIAGRLGKLEGHPYVTLPFAMLSGGILVLGLPLYALIPALVPFGILHVKRNKRLPLLEWIALEERGKAQFERVISWFVDLPNQKEEVRPRRGLVRLLERNVLRRQEAARYVYGLRIIRSGDSLDLVIRLSLVAVVFMWLAAGFYVGIVVPLFVGLAALQLVPLYKRLEIVSMVSWLPVTEAERIDGFKWWVSRLLVIQALALTLVSVLFGATWDAAVGLVLAWLVSRFYLRKLV